MDEVKNFLAQGLDNSAGGLGPGASHYVQDAFQTEADTGRRLCFGYPIGDQEHELTGLERELRCTGNGIITLDAQGETGGFQRCHLVMSVQEVADLSGTGVDQRPRAPVEVPKENGDKMAVTRFRANQAVREGKDLAGVRVRQGEGAQVGMDFCHQQGWTESMPADIAERNAETIVVHGG